MKLGPLSNEFDPDEIRRRVAQDGAEYEAALAQWARLRLRNWRLLAGVGVLLAVYLLIWFFGG
jgi:hypothetical protein